MRFNHVLRKVNEVNLTSFWYHPLNNKSRCTLTSRLVTKSLLDLDSLFGGDGDLPPLEFDLDFEPYELISPQSKIK